jgi:hypothetical protein
MIDKVELIGWIAGLEPNARKLARVEEIMREDDTDREERTLSGMLRKCRPGEADRVFKLLQDTLRDARRRCHLDREALDFWERRLWAWHDKEQAQRGTVVELDEATRQALREALEHLGGGRIKAANDTFYEMRHFMLRAIRAVCAAVVRDREYWPEHDAGRMFEMNAVDVAVRLRLKTAKEGQEEQIQREAERLIES